MITEEMKSATWGEISALLMRNRKRLPMQFLSDAQFRPYLPQIYLALVDEATREEKRQDVQWFIDGMTRIAAGRVEGDQTH